MVATRLERKGGLVKRQSAVVSALVLLMGLIPIGSAAAAGHDGVYISLGDSLAAGTQANEGVVTDDSYTDVLFRRLRDDLGLGHHVKLGCPGETSSTFLAGGCSGEGAIGGYATGTQLGDALVAIAAAGPDLKLITINIGANDVLACVGAPDMNTCLGAALPALAGNLTVILATLQAAAPGVPIVGMNYYNPLLAWVLDDANAPFPGFGALSQVLVTNLNNLLAATYAGSFGPVSPVPMVDVAAAFHTFDDQRNIKYVCRYTLMCERDGDSYVMSDWAPASGPQPDIHPTDIGYQRIAWAFMRTLHATGTI